ncbi:MAG: hypothetical protein KatS3mg082_2047 [Nitrospiraceae bacterium]|nr:MAG: hypothetical protein KatS3mg082_2047 [Nitrospiraceae bacterium]
MSKFAARAACPISVNGCCRFFLDVIAQRFERRDVQHLGAVVQLTGEGLLEERIGARRERRRAFCPNPVGAAIRTFDPEPIAGQLRACTSVGSPNRLRNQSAITGWKRGERHAPGCYHAKRTALHMGRPRRPVRAADWLDQDAEDGAPDSLTVRTPTHDRMQLAVVAVIPGRQSGQFIAAVRGNGAGVEQTGIHPFRSLRG